MVVGSRISGVGGQGVGGKRRVRVVVLEEERKRPRRAMELEGKKRLWEV